MESEESNIIHTLTHSFFNGMSFKENKSINLSWDGQKVLLNSTILNTHIQMYPMNRDYCKGFLKKLINCLEKSNEDVHDELYNSYCTLMQESSELGVEFCYKHYMIKGVDGFITIKESPSLIIHGTTGLRTWEAAAVLADWALVNKVKFKAKHVLELGSGLGMTGIVVSKFCNPESMCFSDCHPRVLKVLEENIHINIPGAVMKSATGGSMQCFSNINACQISILNLDWNDTDSVHFDNIPDIIIGADIIYDSSTFNALCSTFDALLYLNKDLEIFLVCTVRNEKTTQNFKDHLSALKRIAGILPAQTRYTIYNALIQPHLQYLVSVWGSAGGSILRDLQVAQNNVIKYKKIQNYQVSYLYAINNIENAFEVDIDSEDIQPGEHCKIIISFKPKVPQYSYVEYFLIHTDSKTFQRLIIRGNCFGPKCFLDQNKITFTILLNDDDERRKNVHIVNSSTLDAKFQWFLPDSGLSFFQVCTDHCGLIRANGRITTTVMFIGTTVGSFSVELFCLIEHQEPLHLDVVGTLILLENPTQTPLKYLSNKRRKESSYRPLMENFLDFVPYIPAASVFDRYLDFGNGSVNNVTTNVSQKVCVTNVAEFEAHFQWITDPDQNFTVDSTSVLMPSQTSKQFTVRFRPNALNKSYGYLLCGIFQLQKYHRGERKIKNIWFRIPCIGNTWQPCEVLKIKWECQTKIIMPPTVPGMTVYSNFTLSNKALAAWNFLFRAPKGTNFVMMPMCGNILGGKWQIITVAFQPNNCGYFCENWELLINKIDTVRITLYASAESSHIEVMAQSHNPTTPALVVFPAAVTNCSSQVVTHLHNTTRLPIHLRVLSNVTWVGADNGGSIVIRPNEIIPYHWWFFPKECIKIYETTFSCSCICLMNNKAVGEPTEMFINMTGFSEPAHVKVSPSTLNLHDIVVHESATFVLTVFNVGACGLKLALVHETNGMGEDHSTDDFDINPKIIELPPVDKRPSQHCEITGTVVPHKSGSRQIDLKFKILYYSENGELVASEPEKENICTIWYDGIYPTMQVYRSFIVKSPMAISGHCLWNIMDIDTFNKALAQCLPNEPLSVDLYAPNLHEGVDNVEVALVLGCVYQVDTLYSVKRKKLCNCEMIEVQLGISTYEMRHNCIHRPVVNITPMDGIVTPKVPILLRIKFDYIFRYKTVLGFELTLSHERSIFVKVNVITHAASKGILYALRRPIDQPNYLAVMDCGRVPINNLDPVIRIVWLYNPSSVYATWRLLKSSNKKNSAIQCILYFAEVPPLSRVALPIAFLPTEMIDYEEEFKCSFGYEVEVILVKGQGGLPNCLENRLDIPRYIKNIMRAQYRQNVVWLSHEHLTIPVMATYSLARELVALTNDTEHVIRYIWLPERIANIVAFSMTPSWGILQPKATQWITMTVRSLQQPATFTISVVCELLDLTARREYQRNELLRRNKLEMCAQQFIITESGTFYPEINDSPPYVLDLPDPKPFFLTISVAISTQGQRDGVRRLHLRQLLEGTPPYDLTTEDDKVDYFSIEGMALSLKMPLSDVFTIIDKLLWNALHSTMMKSQLQYYAKEEIPTSCQLMKTLESGSQSQISKRVTSDICDAIVNQAIFGVYSLEPKHHIELLKQ